ncbi:MAG: phosphoglucosamine mutase [Flavobacteriales bacterium]
MTLIKSISGIRGTIGGAPGEGLTPLDSVKFGSAYGTWLKQKNNKEKLKVVIGRDARISGKMIENLVASSLTGLGIDVVNLGLSTTPSVELAVVHYNADGGIILTASHNPAQWNALKLLNNKGEFVSALDGAEILQIADEEGFIYSDVYSLGKIIRKEGFLQEHINSILSLPLVQKQLIETRKFRVVVDAVNSTGGIFVPALLKSLGVEVVELYCDPTGDFPHNPEPLPEHLTEICKKVVETKSDLGIVVDPDVDRLALVNEDGTLFGEEYTLVAVADYILARTNGGNTVSNLSSTRALRDVTHKHGGQYFASAVGEVNVVSQMKTVGAVIGGEGNGGIIYPDSHYGRDALVGIALFLSLLAERAVPSSILRASYPIYHMSKNKIELTPNLNVDTILEKVKIAYKNEQINDSDGVKIDFEKGWVHLRKSNTEPIIRIYSEGHTENEAKRLAQEIIDFVNNYTSKNPA